MLNSEIITIILIIMSACHMIPINPNEFKKFFCPLWPFNPSMKRWNAPGIQTSLSWYLKKPKNSSFPTFSFPEWKKIALGYFTYLILWNIQKIQNLKYFLKIFRSVANFHFSQSKVDNTGSTRSYIFFNLLHENQKHLNANKHVKNAEKRLNFGWKMLPTFFTGGKIWKKSYSGTTFQTKI